MVEEKSAGADKKKEDAPKKKKTKQEEQENELSEEDQRLKDDLDLMVTRLEDPEPGLVANAIKVGALAIDLSKVQTHAVCTGLLTLTSPAH